MSVESTFICDGCGKREVTTTGEKPPYWFARTVEGVTQHACSRECIYNKIGGLILPV